MMRTSRPIKKSIFPHLIIIAVAAASCGSYQTSYGDGIYEDVVVQRQNRSRNIPAQQTRPVNNNQTYKDYFASKAKQQEPSSQEKVRDIFTDIDSYSSSNSNGEVSGDAPKKANHPGWGGGVSDLYIDSAPAYQINSMNWGVTSGYLLMNDPYVGGLWNTPGWVGWNANPNWNYGRYGWNSWGWNSPFYGPVSPFWGYGNGWVNNGFYCPAPYYGNAYGTPAVAYVNSRSRRGLNNNRLIRNYNTNYGNSTYTNLNSRRAYGKSNYNSALLSSKSRNQVTNTPTQSRRSIRTNNNYTTRRNITRNNQNINRSNNFTTRRKNTSNSFNRNSNNTINRRSSSSNRSFRSSSSSMRSSRSSSVRSSGGSRRSGGRQ